MDWLIICLLVVIIALQVFFRPRKDHSDIAGELKRLLDEMQRSFERIEKNFREDFRLNREEGRIVARDNREELTRSMNEFVQHPATGKVCQSGRTATPACRQHGKTVGRNPPDRRREIAKDT